MPKQPYPLANDPYLEHQMTRQQAIVKKYGVGSFNGPPPPPPPKHEPPKYLPRAALAPFEQPLLDSPPLSPTAAGYNDEEVLIGNAQAMRMEPYKKHAGEFWRGAAAW